MTSAPERHMVRLDRKPQLFSAWVAALGKQSGLFYTADLLKETV